jgi:6-phosphogluconolactonase (cycloisomerase 2 family)
LQPIQVLPSTPASYSGAETAVAPSGRVVYASNRGHDSIGIFAVNARDGTLTPIGWALTHAKSPRFLPSTPRPKILSAEHRHDCAVQDQPSKRMLTPTGQIIKTNSPCTIVFAGV